MSSQSVNEVMHPVLSDGRRLLVDWRDIDEAMRRDPEGRTIPSDDPDKLMLTGNDCAWLWGIGIGFEGRK